MTFLTRIRFTCNPTLRAMRVDIKFQMLSGMIDVTAFFVAIRWTRFDYQCLDIFDRFNLGKDQLACLILDSIVHLGSSTTTYALIILSILVKTNSR